MSVRPSDIVRKSILPDREPPDLFGSVGRLGWELPVLHRTVVCVVAATVVLSARLCRLHPLRFLVQTIALTSLAAVLSIAVPVFFWLLHHEMDAERSVILDMAADIRSN